MRLPPSSINWSPAPGCANSGGFLWHGRQFGLHIARLNFSNWRAKMRKFYLLAALFLAVVVGNPAAAVTGRFVKDFEHPFVGLAVFYDATGEFIGRCSGSLLSPSLFLTAGHCIEGAASARVYFQQDAGVHYDPVTQLDPVFGYPAGFPNTRDAALVVLDDPIVLSEYGTLAAAGTLDALATRRGHQAIDL